MENKTYTLKELANIDIDSWVQAMGSLDELYGVEVAAMCDYDPEQDCPGEFEEEFTEVANAHGCRFNELGELVKVGANI